MAGDMPQCLPHVHTFTSPCVDIEWFISSLTKEQARKIVDKAYPPMVFSDQNGKQWTVPGNIQTLHVKSGDILILRYENNQRQKELTIHHAEMLERGLGIRTVVMPVDMSLEHISMGESLTKEQARSVVDKAYTREELTAIVLETPLANVNSPSLAACFGVDMGSGESKSVRVQTPVVTSPTGCAVFDEAMPAPEGTFDALMVSDGGTGTPDIGNVSTITLAGKDMPREQQEDIAKAFGATVYEGSTKVDSLDEPKPDAIRFREYT